MSERFKQTLKSGLPKWPMFGGVSESNTSAAVLGFSDYIRDLVESNQGILCFLKEEISKDLKKLLGSMKVGSINCMTVFKVLKKLEKKLSADLSTEDPLTEWMFQSMTTDFLFLYLRDSVIRAILEKFFSELKLWEGWQDIDSWTLKVIDTVLHDRPLSIFLTILKERWLIDISDNIINKFEYEEEVKLINIRKEEIINTLEARWAKMTFKWKVIDEYYDYPEGIEKLGVSGWRKSTFRIRTRIHDNWDREYFYTIKRKITKEEEQRLIREGVMQEQDIETRRCYEKELRIPDIATFRRAIEDFGMDQVRKKEKVRVSYMLEEYEGLKFDFDSYEDYNDMLELEWASNSIIKEVLDDEDLGLSEYDRLVGWESKFKNDSRTRKS